MVLQPAKCIKSEGIENTIELVHRLGKKAKICIPHVAGDEGEGYDYEQRIKEYTRLLNVNLLFISDIVKASRGLTPSGHKIYTIYDIYPHADLISYPSGIEGFGSTFIEAVYFQKPILVNKFLTYDMDIKPKGFDVIELDGYITEESVHHVRMVLEDQDLCQKMVRRNYEIAKNFFAYPVLHQKLKQLIDGSGFCVKY